MSDALKDAMRDASQRFSRLTVNFPAGNQGYSCRPAKGDKYSE